MTKDKAMSLGVERRITATGPQAVGSRLSRELIVEAATRIAVEEGTAKLSLRRLGSHLGVDHTALYRHFRSKAELLDAVADSLLEQHAVLPDAPWDTQIKVGIRHAVHRYNIHPELAQVMAMRPSSSAASARLLEMGVSMLTRAGLSDEQIETVLPVLEAWGVAFGLYGSITRHEAEVSGRPAEVDAFNQTLDAALNMFVGSIRTFAQEKNAS